MDWSWYFKAYLKAQMDSAMETPWAAVSSIIAGSSCKINFPYRLLCQSKAQGKRTSWWLTCATCTSTRTPASWQSLRAGWTIECLTAKWSRLVLTIIRQDPDSATTGKHHNDGVCSHIRDQWGKSIMVREHLCAPDVELLPVSLWSFYLPCCL